jgi:hypothetical protein
LKKAPQEWAGSSTHLQPSQFPNPQTSSKEATSSTEKLKDAVNESQLLRSWEDIKKIPGSEKRGSLIEMGDDETNDDDLDNERKWEYSSREDRHDGLYDYESDRSAKDFAACSLEDCGYCGHCDY